MADLDRAVRERALSLGFDRVGIASAEGALEPEFSRYEAFIEGEKHGKMAYLAESREARRRLDTDAILEGARSVICVAERYGGAGDERGADDGVTSRIARYAQGSDYHNHLRKRLRRLAAFVRTLADGTQARPITDDAPVLERAWAARAGLGFIGKNGLLIAPGLGSFVLIGEVVTTLALTPDTPMAERCGSCSLCLDACPTDAFDRAFVLDPRRCVSYLTIELRGPMPDELRAGVGEHLFGCDDCQDVCPYNRSGGEPSARYRPFDRWDETSLESLVELDDASYWELVLGSPVKRATREGLARNAITVLANRRHPRYRSLLEKAAREHPDPTVRAHAAWGLTLLDGSGESDRVISQALGEVEHREATRALTTRYLDFWLLGGASIVVWVFMFALHPVRKLSWAVDHHYANAFAISNTVALFVNYPHFMASYALAYRKGPAFIRQHWFQLVLVPLALLAIIFSAYASFAVPSETSGAISAANALFAKVGLRTRLGMSPSIGTEMLGLAVTAMYLTVGWHYTKQVYGSMMVYASFDAYPLSQPQRTLLKWNLFGIWWLSFTYYNVSTEPSDFFGLNYFRLGLPHPVMALSAVFLAVTFAATLFWVFGKVYERHKRWPSLNMLVPYVAMYLWWVPMFIQNEYYMYVVPFFHSLQYLPFVYKIEQGRNRDVAPARAERRGTLMMVALVLAGFAFFELVPNTADALLDTKEKMGLWYFFIAAQVFINVHHYFIDNVLWRFKDAEVKKYLLA